MRDRAADDACKRVCDRRPGLLRRGILATRRLHEFASRQRADVLVVGASGRDEVGRLLLGDHTREVLEDARCAAAIAPAGYASRAASIRTIGVAYERSVESERALELARALAPDHRAELRQYGQSVDLLVIGSHKFGPIDRVLEGSTSQRLADELSSPLLVLAAQ